MQTQEGKYIRIQIVISLMTLLFTPFFSGIVVYFQLSKQHQLWDKQREVVKFDDIQTKKIQLFNDLRTAYTKYWNAILNYNLKNIKSIELMARQNLAEDTKILFFDTVSKLRPSSEKFDLIEEQLLQSLNDYLTAERQLRSCLFLVSTTFSDDVASKVRVVEDSIKLTVPDINQINELIPKYEKILGQLQKTKDIAHYNKSITELTSTYLSAFVSEGNKKLRSAMELLCSSMRKESNIQ